MVVPKDIYNMAVSNRRIIISEFNKYAQTSPNKAAAVLVAFSVALGNQERTLYGKTLLSWVMDQRSKIPYWAHEAAAFYILTQGFVPENPGTTAACLVPLLLMHETVDDFLKEPVIQHIPTAIIQSVLSFE